MIVRKTERYYKRKVSATSFSHGDYNEIFLRKTWWIFYIIPVFSTEQVVKSQIIS